MPPRPVDPNTPQRVFTNVSSRPAVTSTTSNRRQNAPSSSPTSFANKVMPLTEKERQVRRMSKKRTAAFGIDPVGGANTMMSGATSFFSPQLSTDFLELPQSLRERREIYRHYYNSDPIVAQSIDILTEIPLSKIRLTSPTPQHCPKGFTSAESYGRYILNFFQKWEKKVRLFPTLVKAVHHIYLDGGIAIFAEDSTVEVPQEVGFDKSQIGVRSIIDDEGNTIEEPEYGWVEKENREELELEYYKRHYKGWDKLITLPIDQVKLTTYSFTDQIRMELIPSDRDKALIAQAKLGNDPVSIEMAEQIPEEVRENLETGNLIPLGTDPDEGSFAYYLAMRPDVGDELGQSILNRVLRTLTYREKLRQAQTQIASRAMTPKRIVWADDISAIDLQDLREQVDLALVDPDYSIVVNYELHWEEMGAKDRLLDLSTEYEITDKQLFAGFGITESLLTGESLYSGDRLKLEVMNVRFMFLREILQNYVEEYLFRPVAQRKGFVELNEWGEEEVLYPKLSFTRLPLRDSQDTFDALFNLYQKGSLPIEVLYEMFGLDPNDMKAKLDRDRFTTADATFNEVLRGIYSAVVEAIVSNTDIRERIEKGLGVRPKAAEPDNRFG